MVPKVFLMGPDNISPDAIRDAFSRLREIRPVDEVDDESLAAFIEDGVDAVDPLHRAKLLRTVGNSPAVASVISALAPAAAAERDRNGDPLIFGLPRRTWRVAVAACAALAIAGSAWLAASPTHSELQLLDGGVDGPTQDFADSLHQTIRRGTVAALWFALALLTLPAFLFGPRQAPRATVSRGSN
jgi:hypothetical protein